MSPDPQVEALRAERAASGSPPLYEMSVADARRADLEAVQDAAGDPEPVARVADLSAPGPAGPVPLRLYAPTLDRPLPALVYFFGGGWVLGTIDTCDAICRSLANRSGCAVVAVGYRLAPEHRFPAAVEDCWAGTTWLAEHGSELGLDTGRLAVGGDSAGGNLAAVMAQRARDQGGPALRFQLLVYPITEHLADTPSMRANDDPQFFNARSSAWYWGHYLADPAQGRDPAASPLRAASFRDLPPALVITAGLDPLCDEGELYAARLADAGVRVELERYEQMIHGFFAMTGVLDASREAHERAAESLARALQVEIRPEREEDHEAARRVLHGAFGSDAGEADLVEALRASGDHVEELCLVAVAGDEVVGHLFFSRARLGSGDDVLALGPMAVLPGWQRRAVGSRLIEEGLRRASETDFPLVVVLGHPEYYPRFGFERAEPYGVTAPWAVPAEAWMVRRLPAYRPDARGPVTYPAAFDAVT